MNFKSLLKLTLGAMAVAGTVSASAQTYNYEAGQEFTVNYKVYKVIGENIVSNGDFASGNYDGWVRNDDGNTVVAEAWDILPDGPDGANYLHCTGAKSGGSGSENNIRCAWELEANTTYLVSYWTINSQSWNRFWNSSLEGVKTPSNDLALLVGSGSSDWVQNSTVFTTTDEAHKAVLNLAYNGNTFGITYICIVPVEYVKDEEVELTTIEPDTYYNLQLVGYEELYVSAGWMDQKQQVLTLPLDEEGYEQAFKFAPVEGKEKVYNMIGFDGKVLYADGGWDFFYKDSATENDLASAAYQFTVQQEVGYITIKTKNSYLGSDGVWSWSKIYTDKTGDKILKFYPEKADVVVGVDAVAAESEAAVEYFNLQGVRVANPENGLYIRRQGDKVSKIIVR